MSAKLIAELYKQHYLGDGGPECRTKVSTVEKALEVYDRLFKHEPSRDLLIEAERTLPETGNPFQGIWKLHELAKLTRGNGPKAEWALQVALNRIRTGSLDPGEFSVRNFSGRGGGRQYVDIILKQRDVKLFLLGPWLDSRSLAPVYKEKLREIFSDPKAYITKLRPLVESDEVDTTWRALWPKSASAALELIEMAAYSMGSMEDAVFRGGRSRTPSPPRRSSSSLLPSASWPSRWTPHWPRRPSRCSRPSWRRWQRRRRATRVRPKWQQQREVR